MITLAMTLSMDPMNGWIRTMVHGLTKNEELPYIAQYNKVRGKPRVLCTLCPCHSAFIPLFFCDVLLSISLIPLGV